MDETENSKPSPRRRTLTVVAVALALVGGGVGATLYFLRSLRYETTDDAFIDGSVTQVAPEVPGRVAKVLVEDNQVVKKGDVLVELDPQTYKIALERAEVARATAEAEAANALASVPAADAKVAQVRADVTAAHARSTLAHTDLKRTRTLFKKGAVPQEALDDADASAITSSASLTAVNKQLIAAQATTKQVQSALKAAQARVLEAKVAIDAANLDLKRTTIRAPVDGRVTNKSVEPGNMVETGQPLLALIQPDVWVTANFKETQVAKMRPGQPVAIRVDAYSGREWKGRIDSLEQGTGARFSLLPPENATGNYVKVVQRIPVKIVFENVPDSSQYLFGIGMSVRPVVNVAVDTPFPMSGRSSESGSESARLDP